MNLRLHSVFHHLLCLTGTLLLARDFFALPASAHTLPISYLRLVVTADYLHAELILNPFELKLMSEADDNKDGELDGKELSAHGQAIAERVTGALSLSANAAVLKPETVGMDPDLSGHHVRVRVHYNLDARRLPLKLESSLSDLTSSSHLTQVTYVNGEHKQLAQLDAHSNKAAFNPPPAAAAANSGAAAGTEKSRTKARPST